MQHTPLLSQDSIREVTLNGVYAQFEDLGHESYDVVLDINSQKFLVHVTTAADRIENFEVLVAKSFYDVTQKTILLLRRLVHTLWEKLLTIA